MVHAQRKLDPPQRLFLRVNKNDALIALGHQIGELEDRVQCWVWGGGSCGEKETLGTLDSSLSSSASLLVSSSGDAASDSELIGLTATAVICGTVAGGGNIGRFSPAGRPSLPIKTGRDAQPTAA